MKGEVIVVGGGAAGLEVAGQLAKNGFMVTIAEKNDNIGGHIQDWHQLFPDRRSSKDVLNYLVQQAGHANIQVLTGTIITDLERKNGAFILKTAAGKELRGDAVVIASGFDLFRSERKEEYGYGIYENVITSADLESMFRGGKIKLADGSVPGRIGVVHCVGSRDEKVGNLYCSKLCCVTAVKQAIEIKEHLTGARIYCFYMDMRMGGANYEELYHESQEKYGINYIRGKVSELSVNIDGKLVAKVEDTLAGRPLRMELDMVVLMAGMEISGAGKVLAENSGLRTTASRFFAPADNHFGSNRSDMEGIFLAGTCIAPMNITDTISHARAAASEVADYLSNGKR